MNDKAINQEETLDTSCNKNDQVDKGSYSPYQRLFCCLFNIEDDDFVINESIEKEIDDMLSTLTPREERIIRMRFGLDDNQPKTLDELSKEFELTRENIRQIEAKTLRNMRLSSSFNKLKDFLK